MNFKINNVKTMPLGGGKRLLYISIELYSNSGQLIHHNDFLMEIYRAKVTYTGPVLGPEDEPDPANYSIVQRTRAEIRAEVAANIRRYIKRLKDRSAGGLHVMYDDRDQTLTLSEDDPDGLAADIAGLIGQEISE